MKLKLFIATAAVAMACSVAVSAKIESVGAKDGDVPRYGTVQDATDEQSQMLAVNVGDTINITVTNATGDVTLLSYKADESAPDSANIQYVDQYEDSDNDGNVNIAYKIRELEGKDGVYCLKINDGSGSATTVYYKVGTPELVDASENIIKNYYVQYNFGENFSTQEDGTKSEYAGTSSVVYRAKLNGNGGTITGYGFNVGKTNVKPYAGKLPVDTEGKEAPVTISGDFAFDVTIYNIKGMNELEDLKVSPYVNYQLGDTSSSENTGAAE